mmetsp:Transcript_410/g.773  ORF Transcript_410/g.773 Transcript_410/m.773 type:complete len:280 (+) Transcript_410:93-932(+)|eukprot:CAMPEP_0184691590 /NCGR_PEP_ID=MMETSP0313-20130426/397_1 /TAXON_ID=2792 /ORGANISM="Porphyridium aerugineum, Strain SAG 1380-2" /LENGTH=279 /DNA_ID=CAMNT_0027149335 /DNA_START=64 /DNA_END=903 /DNA_ORIENTATION=+
MGKNKGGKPNAVVPAKDEKKKDVEVKKDKDVKKDIIPIKHEHAHEHNHDHKHDHKHDHDDDEDDEEEMDYDDEDLYDGYPDDDDMSIIEETLFWGMNLKAGEKESISIESEEQLVLSMASLTADSKDQGRTVVQVKIGEEVFTLAVLLPGKVESVPLSLTLSDEEEIEFSTVGKNPVCLTGNLVIRIDPRDMMGPDMDMEDDEDDEDGEGKEAAGHDDEDEDSTDESEDDSEESEEDDKPSVPSKRPAPSSKGATPAKKPSQPNTPAGSNKKHQHHNKK